MEMVRFALYFKVQLQSEKQNRKKIKFTVLLNLRPLLYYARFFCSCSPFAFLRIGLGDLKEL